MKDTWCCQCEIGPGNNITLIRLSEPRSETHQPAPRRSPRAEMVWDCFSVAPAAYFSLWSGCGLWITHPSAERSPWTGEDKSTPPYTTTTFICLLPNTLLLWLLRVVVCHLVLRWWNAIVLQKTGRLPWVVFHGGKRVGECGWKKRMIGCFQKWFVWKTTEVPETPTQCSRLKMHNFNATKNKIKRLPLSWGTMPCFLFF